MPLHEQEIADGDSMPEFQGGNPKAVSDARVIAIQEGAPHHEEAAETEAPKIRHSTLSCHDEREDFGRAIDPEG